MTGSRVCLVNDAELHGFHPFNDAYEQKRSADSTSLYETTSDGINTRDIDQFRQGVEITTPKFQNMGVQPKMWAGNICGFTRVNTYGQFENYVEFSGVTTFDDEKQRFNPVNYIEHYGIYPYTLEFNDGPAQKYETAMEPFTIPFRFNTNEDVKTLAHSIKGAFGDYDGFEITQKQEYYNYTTHNDHCSWVFLDEGTRYFGQGSYEDCVVIDGYVSTDLDCISPFDDTRDKSPSNPLMQYLSNPDISLIDVLMSSSMDWNLDEDIRETYTNRSTTAGSIVYGPSQRIYGTDSIAFAGIIKGS